MAAALVGGAFVRSVIDEGSQILRRLDDLLGQTIYLGLIPPVPTRPLQRLHAPLVVKESDVVGRDGDKEQIIELLLSDDTRGNNLSVIPIVGMGGVGKTTLAQLVYKDSRVQQHFDFKVWVTVSEEFDVLQITRRILEKVTSRTCNISDIFDLQSELSEALAGKKFLFVLDDVWNENYGQWDSLKSAFQSGEHGSRIIVTTRSKDVALTMSKGVMHELKLVSDEDCWLLFQKHAFDDNQAPTEELKTIGHKIVERCKGLPLAVKSIAGLLRTTSNAKEWEQILKSDVWLKKDIVPALWLSYHFLPPVLKRCFAYCSIFPKDYEFEESDTGKIIWLWMAEGLLTPEKGKRIEDVGESYLQALISRSFFQPSSRDKSAMVMHDLVHDLAMFISGEFCFSCGDSNDLSNLGTKSCHLSYRKTSDDLMKLGAVSQSREKKLMSLRTLLALPLSKFFVYKPVLELHELFLKVGGCLRVLSLSDSSTTELPDSIGNMKYLRYLDLSDTRIKELPDFICTLYNLQTLLLSGCRELERLPTGLAALFNLRHLDIRGAFCIKEMPPQMCKMKSLQTLSDFVLGENDNWRIKELGEFPLLEGRLCISGLQYIVDVKDVLEANLKDKKFLSELILKWDTWGDSNITSPQREREREVLEALQPHTNLKQLTIEGYRGTLFPDWVGNESFCNMVQVVLFLCRNVCMLPPLGQLCSLRRLVILRLDGVVSIGNEFCGSSSTTTNHPFTSLEELNIRPMASWEKWSFSSDRLSQEGGVFPSLTELRIVNCWKLIVGLPDCHLPSLKSIQIAGCDEMESVFVCQSRQEMDTNAFSSLQSIEISRCKKLIVGLPDCHLPSLKSIQIADCDEMESVFVCQSRREMDTNAFPSLQSIEISRCKKLIVGLPDCHLPSLKSIQIADCDEMESVFVCQSRQEMDTNAFSSLQSLEISRCKKLIVGLPDCHLLSLKSIQIADCDEMESVFVCQSRQEMDTNAFPSFQSIEIWRCKKLIVGLPDCHLPSLKSIQIAGCDEMESVFVCQSRQEMDTNAFPSLQSIEIWRCKKLIVGLPDCHLPSLKSIQIADCDEMESVFVCQSRQEMDTNAFPSLQSIKILRCKKLIVGLPDCHLPSLKSIQIAACDEMEGVFVCQSRQEMDTNAFPSLQSIEISRCEKLIVGLPDCHLPSLKSIQIADCDEMESVFVCQSRQEMDTNAFPSLQSIKILSCKKLIVGLPDCHLPSLKSIQIAYCDEMESVFVCQSHQEMDTNAFPSLQSIEISRCEKLIVGLPDCHLPSLKSIQIAYCDEMESVFVCQSHQEMDTNAFPSLQSIEISRCEKLIVGLPDCHLPSLKSIQIAYCDEMEGVFVCQCRQEMDTNAFPSLQSIKIIGCKKLWENRMKWGLERLPSLMSLYLNLWGTRIEEEVDSFPEEGLLPTTLTKLSICNFEKLKGLDGRAFQHLTSLRNLKIGHCSELECLPQEGLPLSLSRLTIWGCSEVLKQRCQRGTGEDWPKIQHIPEINIQ